MTVISVESERGVRTGTQLELVGWVAKTSRIPVPGSVAGYRNPGG